MRLFIALTLPERARERLADVQRRVHQLGLPLRTTRAEELHLTLAFLGETADERLDTIRHAMGDAAAVPSFQLALAGLGTFPLHRRPTVLWVGLTGDLSSLTTLHTRLNERLAASGLPAETRAFRPHVTLGRAHADWSPEQLAVLRELLADPSAALESWRVDALHLVRSELHPHGARYTTLYTCALKG